MKVSIKSKDLNLTLPVPLSMGTVIIRCIPKKHLNTEQKKIALQLFKSVKSSLKGYKGLQVVEVVSQEGEYISITI